MVVMDKDTNFETTDVYGLQNFHLGSEFYFDGLIALRDFFFLINIFVNQFLSCSGGFDLPFMLN